MERSIKYDFNTDGIEVFEQDGKYIVMDAQERVEYSTEDEAINVADVIVATWNKENIE